MSYAEVGALKGRAGRLADAWTATSQPSENDLENFLEQVAAVIDAHLAAYGITVPVTDAGARAALEALNADGALILALEATWPKGASAPAGTEALLEGARLRFYGQDGRSPNVGGVIPLIEVVDPTPGASSLWTDEALVANESLPGELLSIGTSMRL